MTSLPVSESADGYPPREERRPVSLSGWLTRRGRTEAFDFQITNLSYGGCRLSSPAKLAAGDEVDLTVMRRGAIPAVVRWNDGESVGLSFINDQPSRPHKPRKVDRFPLSADLIVRRTGRRAQQLAVSDLSRFGCCLTFDDPQKVGDWIWVALPGLAPIEARIRWTDNRRTGVEFVHPIHDTVFDLLLLRWGLSAG